MLSDRISALCFCFAFEEALSLPVVYMGFSDSLNKGPRTWNTRFRHWLQVTALHTAFLPELCHSCVLGRQGWGQRQQCPCSQAVQRFGRPMKACIPTATRLHHPLDRLEGFGEGHGRGPDYHNIWREPQRENVTSILAWPLVLMRQFWDTSYDPTLGNMSRPQSRTGVHPHSPLCLLPVHPSPDLPMPSLSSFIFFSLQWFFLPPSLSSFLLSLLMVVSMRL